MWVLYSKSVAIITNVVLGAFMLLFVRNGLEIYDRLVISEKEAVSGKFTTFDHYESMGALDDSEGERRGKGQHMTSGGAGDTYSNGSGIGQSRQGVALTGKSTFVKGSLATQDQTNPHLAYGAGSSMVRRAGTPEMRQQRQAAANRGSYDYGADQQPQNKAGQNKPGVYDKGNSFVINAFQNAFNPKGAASRIKDTDQPQN